MAGSRQADSQGIDDSSSHIKLAGNLSPATYYHDPARQRRQRQWNIAKFVLNCILWCLAFSLLVINILLFSWLGSRPDPGGFTIYPAGCSLAWISAEFLVIAFRRSLGRGIDTRYHLSAHLILWCSCSVLAGMITFNLPYYPTHYGSTPYESWFFVQWRFAILEPLIVLLTVLHFILFVRCCVEVNRTNHEKQVARVFRALAQLNPHDKDDQIAAPPPVLLHGPQRSGAAQPVQPAETIDKLEIPLGNLQQIPRRPVGGPISMPPAGTAPDSYRILDPDVEANLKFMGPLPVESVSANHKYPSRIIAAKPVDREVGLHPEATMRRLSL